MTNDLLSKMAMVGKNLDEFSVETVKMFHQDAESAGYTLDTEPTKSGV
jgi:transaldolase